MSIPTQAVRRRFLHRACWWTLGPLALAVLTLATSNSIPVTVQMVDCGIRHKSGLCELASDGSLKLLVTAPDNAKISVFQGLFPLRTKEITTPAGRLLHINAWSVGTSLSVYVWRWRGFSSLRLPLSQSRSPSWLRQAERLWNENQVASAEQTLKTHIDGALSDEERARALGLWARILLAQNQQTECEQRYKQAIDADRKAGLVSLEIDHVLGLSTLLGLRQFRLREAEALFDERQALFQQVPEMRPWEVLHRAKLRILRGDLVGGLESLDHAESLTAPFDDRYAQLDIGTLRAHALALLGRYSEAANRLSPLRNLAPEGCRRVYVLRSLAWVRILALESSLSTPTADSDLYLELNEALRISRTQCDDARLLATVLTDLVHALIISGNFSDAQARLFEAQGALGEKDAELSLEWHDLQGQIHKATNNLKASRREFQMLADLGNRSNAYESVWRAKIGLAQVTEAEDAGAALRLYSEAEDYLKMRSQGLPFAMGRGTFLGRYEPGTRFHLDLLAKQGKLTEAMQLVRVSRLRTFRDLARMERLRRLSPVDRERFNALLTDYYQARAELNRLVVEQEWAARADEDRLRQQIVERSQQLLAILQASLERLGIPASATTWRPPASNEAILTCHPARHDWLCFLATAQSVHAARLARMDREMDAQEMSRRLLDPFRASLERLKSTGRLRILSYGLMRELDIHLLPFWEDGKSLTSHLEVVYSLDLPIGDTQTQRVVPPPPVKSAEAARGLVVPTMEALVVVDPEGNLPHSREAAGAINQTLHDAGWKPILQVGGAASIGTWSGKQEVQPTPAIETDLRKQLEQIPFFIYLGHADFSESGNWQHILRTANEAGFRVGDILALGKVPPWVALFGCDTGRSSEETGGQEGIGLAQAFLFRGSDWVLGTIRPVNDRVAAAVAKAFVEHLTSDGNSSPSAALRTAVMVARTQLLHEQVDRAVESDLGNFRIFEP